MRKSIQIFRQLEQVFELLERGEEEEEEQKKKKKKKKNKKKHPPRWEY